MHRDGGAVSYRGGVLAVVDHRPLRDTIDPERDLVPDAARDDLDHAFGTAERERHGDDRLYRVALLAAVRRDVSFAAGGAGREVEDRGDGLSRDAWPVVAHSNPAAGDGHADHRRNASLLAGVERVVGQLLQDNERPVVGLVTGLSREFLLATELEQPTRA